MMGAGVEFIAERNKGPGCETVKGRSMMMMPITPAQIVAARRLLGWSRDRLALRIGVSNTTLERFGKGRLPGAFCAQSARIVLEAASVEFTAENSDGPGAIAENGVLLRKPLPPPASPSRI